MERSSATMTPPFCRPTSCSPARFSASGAASSWAFVHSIPTEASCKCEYVPRKALIRLDARLLDYLRPLRDFGLDERSELLGRIANQIIIMLSESCAHVGLCQCLDGFEMEPANDRRWGPCWRKQSVPLRNFEARIARLGDGR